MKTILPILAIAFSLSHLAYGQSTREVIESPKTAEGKIYFDTSLRISLNPDKVDFVPLKGKIISIRKNTESDYQMDAKERAFTVYVEAYNPLHYSLNSSSKVVVDSLNLRLNTAIGEMLNTLGSFTGGEKGGPEAAAESQCPYYTDINKELLEIVESIRRNQKPNGEVKWSGWSQSIIDLRFRNKSETDAQLGEMTAKLILAKATYDSIYNRLATVKADILNTLESEGRIISCALSLEIFLVKTERIRKLADDQKKYLDTFGQLLQTVKKGMKDWKSEEAAGRWFIVAEKGTVSKDSNVVVELKMIKHRMSAEKDGTVKQAGSEEVASASIQLIRHRNFVPEVSAGTYYSFQEQDSYRMAEDGGGTVVRIGQRDFEGVALSTMLNFYLNERDWQVLPYWQVGLGIQNKLPLLMCGAGFRIGLNERAFSLAGGVSITAIEGLDQLNIGDAVTDDAQIESDLRYKFSGPKAYFGIQYHF